MFLWGQAQSFSSNDSQSAMNSSYTQHPWASTQILLLTYWMSEVLLTIDFSENTVYQSRECMSKICHFLEGKWMSLLSLITLQLVTHFIKKMRSLSSHGMTTRKTVVYLSWYPYLNLWLRLMMLEGIFLSSSLMIIELTLWEQAMYLLILLNQPHQQHLSLLV